MTEDLNKSYIGLNRLREKLGLDPINHDSYTEGDRCCNEACLYESSVEPCWGDVELRDVDYYEETNEEWRTHACEGHAEYNMGQPYEPPPRGKE